MTCSPTEYGRDGSTTVRKFGPEVLGDLHVLRPAQQEELGLAVEARQVLQQVPDVGPDAEVVQFPGVNGDAHVGVSVSAFTIPQARLPGPTVATSASPRRQLAAQAEIRPQQRRPRRVVLLVERHLAAAVGAAGLSPAPPPRRASQVHHFGVGREQNPAAGGAQRRAEIHVFRVQEIALVEEAGGQRVRAPDQQARAADPVGIVPPPRLALDPGDGRPPRRDRTGARSPSGAASREGRHHRAERHLGAAVRADQARARGRDAGVGLERPHERVDRPGRHHACRCSAAARTRSPRRGSPCCSRPRSRRCGRRRSAARPASAAARRRRSRPTTRCRPRRSGAPSTAARPRSTPGSPRAPPWC